MPFNCIPLHFCNELTWGVSYQRHDDWEAWCQLVAHCNHACQTHASLPLLLSLQVATEGKSIYSNDIRSSEHIVCLNIKYRHLYTLNWAVLPYRDWWYELQQRGPRQASKSNCLFYYLACTYSMQLKNAAELNVHSKAYQIYIQTRLEMKKSHRLTCLRWCSSCSRTLLISSVSFHAT